MNIYCVKKPKPTATVIRFNQNKMHPIVPLQFSFGNFASLILLIATVHVGVIVIALGGRANRMFLYHPDT